MGRPKKLNKQFPIISVSREDILGLEKADWYKGANGKIKKVFTKKDILSLDDGDMASIASKLNDDYREQLYWTSLEIIVENYLSQKKENEKKNRSKNNS